MPGESVISRVLTFPFSNPQKISKTLPFELESFVPFNVEELVIDYHILASSSRKTEVLVVAVHKETLQRRVDFLTTVGLDVRSIEVQSLALFNAYRWVHPNLPKEGTVLLDIGSTSTSLCLIGPKGVWGIRTVLCGEKDIAEGVAQTVGVVEGHADNSQMQEEERTSWEESISDSPSNTFDNPAWVGLLQNLRTTIHAFETHTNIEVVQAYVGGGGAHVKALPAYLKSQMALPNVQVLSAKAAKGMRTLSPVFLPSLGLSVKFALGAKGSSINLKRKITKWEDEKQDAQHTWTKIAVAVGMLIVLSFINVFVTHQFKQSRYEELTQHLRSQFHEVFPQAKVIVDEIQQTQTAIIQNQRMLKFFSGDHTTVLQILAELSQRLAQEGETEVHEVLIDGQVITLQATTRSFEAVERIKQKVSQVSWVQTLQVLDAQVGANSNRVKFGLNVKIGTA